MDAADSHPRTAGRLRAARRAASGTGVTLTTSPRARFAATASGILLAACLAWPMRGQDAADDVLASVGDDRITRADLTAFLARSGIDRQPNGEQRRPEIVAAALERLIDERLLRSAVAAAGIEIAPEEVKAALAQVREQLHSVRGGSLEKIPEPSGNDAAELGRRIEFDLAVTKLIAPQVDEAAIAASFAKHRRDLDGTRVRASHIVLRPDIGGGDDAVAATFRRAADVRAAIVRHDLSFAEAAALHSAGPSRHRGGDVGFLKRQGDVDEAFARVAFALDVGDVSEPFATSFGVHLVTVTAIEPGTATLEKLRPQVARLAAQEVTRRLVSSLRRTTPITYSSGFAQPRGSAARDAAAPNAGAE